MLRSSIPLRFTLPWGKNAAGAFIRTVPVTSEIGIQDGAASFNDGFVPDNFTPLAGGGVPPFGQDFNGITNIMTTWDIWYQAGAPITYDVTFSTAQSGYPSGAKVDSSIVLGAQWYSLVDSNTTNPDDPLTSTNWARVGIPAGTPVPFLAGTLPAGFVPINALTIGDASSNATGRANPDTLFAFVAVWALATSIFTSAGVPSTKGANPVADFNAHKQLALPDMRGLGVLGVDALGSTYLTGVPVVSGNSTTPGSILGSNTQALGIGDLPTITPAGVITNGGITITNGGITITNGHITTTSNLLGLVSGGSGAASGANLTPNTQTITSTQAASTASQATTTASQATSTFAGTPFGSNTPHNNTERSALVSWGMKL